MRLIAAIGYGALSILISNSSIVVAVDNDELLGALSKKPHQKLSPCFESEKKSETSKTFIAFRRTRNASNNDGKANGHSQQETWSGDL